MDMAFSTFTSEGQGCRWDLYGDKAAYFLNGTVTSVPEEEEEEEAGMKCLWVTTKVWL